MAAVKERTNQLAAAGKNAVVSGAYIWPLHGITFFLSHTSLHKPLWKVALPATLLSLGVLAGVFGLLYLPQVAALAVVNGPIAFVNAALLCLSESSFLITTLSRAFLLEDALLAVFDATLVEKGQESLVSKGRELKGGAKKGSVEKLGKLMTKPMSRFSPRALIEYLIFLPLNAIPVVGTAAFVILQGYKSGPRIHERYFNLKQWTPEQKASFIKSEQGAYTAFGVASALLGMIPFASIPIQFTNTVGGALWAANIESSGSTGIRTASANRNADAVSDIRKEL